MALGCLTEKKGIRNLQDFMLKIIVSTVSLYTFWEMIVACRIILASEDLTTNIKQRNIVLEDDIDESCREDFLIR